MKSSLILLFLTLLVGVLLCDRGFSYEIPMVMPVTDATSDSISIDLHKPFAGKMIISRGKSKPAIELDPAGIFLEFAKFSRPQFFSKININPTAGLEIKSFTFRNNSGGYVNTNILSLIPRIRFVYDLNSISGIALLGLGGYLSVCSGKVCLQKMCEGTDLEDYDSLEIGVTAYGSLRASRESPFHNGELGFGYKFQYYGSMFLVSSLDETMKNTFLHSLFINAVF